MHHGLEGLETGGLLHAQTGADVACRPGGEDAERQTTRLTGATAARRGQTGFVPPQPAHVGRADLLEHFDRPYPVFQRHTTELNSPIQKTVSAWRLSSNVQSTLALD